jgi:hypothetical protein
VDDRSEEQRPRASLRGKGREILLGQQAGESGPLAGDETPPDSPQEKPEPEQADPAALSLTPEEADALLDFSPDAPVDLDFPAEQASPAPPAPEPDIPPDQDDDLLDWMADEPATEYEESPGQEADAQYDLDDLPLPDPEIFPEPDEDMMASLPDESAADADPFYADIVAEDAADLPAEPVAESPAEPFDEPLPEPPGEGWREPAQESIDYLAEEAPAPPVEEGFPLAEREAGYPFPSQPLTYRPAPEVESLDEYEPEVWPETTPDEVAEGAAEAASAMGEQAEEHEGGLGVQEGLAGEAAPAQTITDPFVPTRQRQPADQLFQPTAPADDQLLGTLVDDERLRRLWDQIEALQEELVQEVRGDRGSTDVFQQELLRASSLLLESRQNYDDARAIVYRVRADLNRQRKVEADVIRYRPWLLNYYLGWGVALVVLFLLKELFAGVGEAVGVEVVASLYYPALLGVAGALISGVLTLERHTTRLLDFDPIHISWYLINPLLGGVMGLLMFLLASIANEDLLQDSASTAERAITYLLCVVAGMNQNNVLRQLNELLRRFGSGQRP